MTVQKAIQKARARAKKIGEIVYIVRDDSRGEARGNDYHLASEFDLDTFFLGSPCLYAIDQSGDCVWEGGL